jgi:hypothetical protein
VLSLCKVHPLPSLRLHTVPDGRVYRIDIRSGKTNLLDGGSFREVAEPGMPQLVVGKVYRSEDGKSTFEHGAQGDPTGAAARLTIAARHCDPLTFDVRPLVNHPCFD